MAPDHVVLSAPPPLIQRLPLLHGRSPLYTHFAQSVRTLYKRPSRERWEIFHQGYISPVPQLNLVKAEFVYSGFFYRTVNVDGALYHVVCGNADIKTNYGMGTAAMTLLSARLGT